MRILFTGGGTGGHFYPIVAVVEELRRALLTEQRGDAEFYYISDTPYDAEKLAELGLSYTEIRTGKLRRYFSLKNISDFIRTGFAVLKAFIVVLRMYPSVVFSKGAYASFPVVAAARILGIPVMLHESDSKPGRVNRWTARFARRIAVSYPDAFVFFDKERTAVTGNPIRSRIMQPVRAGAHEFFGLDPTVPTLVVLGGSQGAEHINDTIVDALSFLLERYQVIHQVGKGNYEGAAARVSVLLEGNEYKGRYKLFAYFDDNQMVRAAGAATLVISRAGSAIFEIAQWGLPSIIIPIPESVSHDQLSNAFTYARSGAAVVIEDENLTPSILLSEIERLIADAPLRERMSSIAKSQARPDAARIIARELITLATTH